MTLIRETVAYVLLEAQGYDIGSPTKIFGVTLDQSMAKKWQEQSVLNSIRGVPLLTREKP